MLSKEWVRLGYRKARPMELSEIASLTRWVDEDMNLIGVTVSFNQMTTICYDLSKEEWRKCFENIFKCSPEGHSKGYVCGFFAPPNDWKTFETAMSDSCINFSKFVWY